VPHIDLQQKESVHIRIPTSTIFQLRQPLLGCDGIAGLYSVDALPAHKDGGRNIWWTGIQFTHIPAAAVHHSLLSSVRHIPVPSLSAALHPVCVEASCVAVIFSFIYSSRLFCSTTVEHSKCVKAGWEWLIAIVLVQEGQRTDGDSAKGKDLA